MNSSLKKKKNRVKLYNPYKIILKDNHKTKNYSCFAEITKDILAAFGIIPVTDTHLRCRVEMYSQHFISCFCSLNVILRTFSLVIFKQL